MYNSVTKYKEDFPMTLAKQTTVKLNYSNKIITIVHDFDDLLISFINFLHSRLFCSEIYEENSANYFVFSEESEFNLCVTEAIAIGLLPV